MQEAVWAEILLKSCSLALAFLTIVLTLSVSKLKAALTCTIVCFYLKVQRARLFISKRGVVEVPEQWDIFRLETST